MNFNLTRFLNVHEQYYPKALEELKYGKKTSHWIWCIFPQIKGLGDSEISRI